MPSRQQQSQSNNDIVLQKLRENSQNGTHDPTLQEQGSDRVIIGSDTERSQDLRAAIDSVFAIVNLEMRTMLTPQQLVGVNSLLTYADFHQTQFPKASTMALKLAHRLMMLRVSGKRGKEGSGRDDMLAALKSALAPIENMETVTGKNLRKLLG